MEDISQHDYPLCPFYSFYLFLSVFLHEFTIKTEFPRKCIVRHIHAKVNVTCSTDKLYTFHRWRILEERGV